MYWRGFASIFNKRHHLQEFLLKLHHKQYADRGEPLIILHGLYGNIANWNWHARQLAEQYAVYAFDARNHGQSPWADTMSFGEMANDAADTMSALGLDSAHVLGHSMGGKTAMRLALQQPQRVRSLIVVDIAPVSYPLQTDNVLQALLALEPGKLKSRAEADRQLAERIPEKAVRAFLLTNLERSTEGGGYQWRFNLPAIERYLTKETDWVYGLGAYTEPALFIRGENSSYMLAEHRQQTLEQFPAADLVTVEGAGHWVHSEKPEAVLRLIQNFLAEEGSSTRM